MTQFQIIHVEDSYELFTIGNFILYACIIVIYCKVPFFFFLINSQFLV